MKRIFIGIVLISSLASCGDSQEQKVNDLFEKTMHEHDEVMARMTDIVEVQNQVDSLLKDTTIDNQLREDLLTLQFEASLAESGMMDWMAEAGTWTSERKKMSDSAEWASLSELSIDINALGASFDSVFVKRDELIN